MKSTWFLVVWLCLLPVISFAADKVVVIPFAKGQIVGQQNITPGTSDKTITEGYHDGTGAVKGDADLIPANIKSGVSIFGVNGNFTCPSRRCGEESVPHCWTAVSICAPPPALCTKYAFECVFEMQDCLDDGYTQQECDEFQNACIIVGGGIEPIP